MALNKSTSVSAIYHWTGGDVVKNSSSSYAVNGKNNQQTVLNYKNDGDGYFPKVCTIAVSDGSVVWWMVDLGDTFNIASVQVWGVPGINKQSFVFI